MAEGEVQNEHTLALHPGFYSQAQRIAFTAAAKELIFQNMARRNPEIAVARANAIFKTAYQNHGHEVSVRFDAGTGLILLFLDGVLLSSFRSNNNGNGNGGGDYNGGEKPGMFDPNDPDRRPGAWLGCIMVASLGFWLGVIWFFFGWQAAVWVAWGLAVLGTILFHWAKKKGF